VFWPDAGGRESARGATESDGTVEGGIMAGARGLTALAASVKKCADNNGGQAKQALA
jgi:hypothetical protein